MASTSATTATLPPTAMASAPDPISAAAARQASASMSARTTRAPWARSVDAML